MGTTETQGRGSANPTPRHDSAATKFRWALRTLVAVLSVTVRLFMGLMFTATGTGWFRRADPIGYLSDAITSSLAAGRPPAPMAAFLEAVVVPNPGVFTALVAIGETAVGLSLLLGIRPRWGVVGGAFLGLTYALAFDGQVLVPGNQLLFAIFILLWFGKPDRWLRLDRRFALWRAQSSRAPSPSPPRTG